MKLYFKDSYDRRRLIDKPKTYNEADKIIYDFCKARDFRIYYIRNWIENGELVYDVGSHTEFFYLANDDGVPMTLDY